MKFAIALLIGAASANEPVWGLTSVQGHRSDVDTQKAYGDWSTTQANGRPPYQSAVQMKHKEDSSDSSSSDSDSDDNNVQLNGLPDAVYEVHESKKGNAELGRYERVT